MLANKYGGKYRQDKLVAALLEQLQGFQQDLNRNQTSGPIQDILIDSHHKTLAEAIENAHEKEVAKKNLEAEIEKLRQIKADHPLITQYGASFTAQERSLSDLDQAIADTIKAFAALKTGEANAKKKREEANRKEEEKVDQPLPRNNSQSIDAGKTPPKAPETQTPPPLATAQKYESPMAQSHL